MEHKVSLGEVRMGLIMKALITTKNLKIVIFGVVRSTQIKDVKWKGITILQLSLIIKVTNINMKVV